MKCRWMFVVYGLVFLGGICPARPQGSEMLALPDRFVLKEGEMLPTGVTSREFQGYVVDEAPDFYRVETSARKGISTVVTIPKKSVEKVERGDASPREYQILQPKLEHSPVSLEVRVYREQLLKPVEEFLVRFPDSAYDGELKAFRAGIEKEIGRVQEGWFRVGAYWFQPEQLPAANLPDWKLFLSLRDEAAVMPVRDLSATWRKVAVAKENFLYPQTVLMLRGILAKRLDLTRQQLTAAQIDRDAAKASGLEQQMEDESKLLLELQKIDVQEKARGLDHLQQAKEALLRDPVDLEGFKTEYQASKEFWPDLKDREGIVLAVLRTRARQLREAFGDATLESTITGTEDLAKVLELMKDKDEAFKKEIAELEKKARARLYEVLLEKSVAEGNLREALGIFGKLKSLGGRASSDLARLEKELIALEYEHTKAEIQKLKVEGDFKKILAALEQADAVVKSRGANEQASNHLGIEAAALAKEAALQFKLYTAAEAAFLAHKIAPGASQVRTVYWASWGILGFAVLLVLVVVLLVYAFFDNILHQWRYRIRLRALREDDKSRNLKRRKNIKRSK